MVAVLSLSLAAAVANGMPRHRGTGWNHGSGYWERLSIASSYLGNYTEVYKRQCVGSSFCFIAPATSSGTRHTEFQPNLPPSISQCRDSCSISECPIEEYHLDRCDGPSSQQRRWYLYSAKDLYPKRDIIGHEEITDIDPYEDAYPQAYDEDEEYGDLNNPDISDHYEDPDEDIYEDEQPEQHDITGGQMAPTNLPYKYGPPGRFAQPKFMAGTHKLLKAATNKLRGLFNWRKNGTDMNVQENSNTDESKDQEPQPYHSTKKYTDKDVLDLPYVESRNVNLSFDRWPDNCFIRIRLESNHSFLAKLAADRLIQGIREHTNLRVGNTKAMPKRRKKWCLLSSPHVDKRSKDLFEIEQHVRFLDVFPPVKSEDQTPDGVSDADTREDTTNVDHITPDEADGRFGQIRSVYKKRGNTFNGLLMVPIPSMVSFDYWFEEVHKPVKNKSIDKTFSKCVWVSKYFLHNYEKREKAEIIDELTSPELYPEIPLRWKMHPCDYFGLQLGELRKLHKFVVTRRAEDEARRRYGVPMPEYMDIGEVRFVPNEEDRRHGYISSDDEDDEVEIVKQLAELEKEEKETKRRR
ncbi:30S ribosomal protein S10 [Babesia ovis]|uniref:30S ribosomal protein S10 n=1 Tax=Babesia ovis TaxID=5869 RepID=A0A9W5WUS1_BABOV|nr:30S ribosomal protein S10 [Babesia ovis]